MWDKRKTISDIKKINRGIYATEGTEQLRYYSMKSCISVYWKSTQRIRRKSGRWFIILLITGTVVMSCNYFRYKYEYTGNIDLTKYPQLHGKKIFLDPGHGGKGETDPFRIGPDGIREEETNLKTALILENMLKRAGAVISMSRKSDKDIPLRERVDMVKAIGPDLLISLHHNGTVRRMDEVNYPSVLIWGNKEVRPLSYSFAKLLIDEFHKIMDERGKIISDFTIYTETGTMILRETRNVCPGVIGEPGFFSDEKHSMRLNDIQFNQLEAEAYFFAIAEFFNRGIPKAEVYISCPIEDRDYLRNLIDDKKPVIAIKLDSGIEGVGIDFKSLKVTYDGITVKCKRLSDDLYRVDYGKEIYPGGHSIRFSFLNMRSQSSMIYRAGFIRGVRKGDYDMLVTSGTKSVKRWRSAKEGLRMLLSALSLGVTDPDADRIIWNIARGFKMIGDKTTADYYYAKLYHFYPQSRYSKRLSIRVKGYRFPVEYLGKIIRIKHDPSLSGSCGK
ncbi:MAG: N-acetylmuramoyl-L-alanine amidase [Spirochaetota bacterium]|nr:N-acetylmuramoyl-L-alanine amidase [Spirochaetota bacterium]